jgi:hypothetical protein
MVKTGLLAVRGGCCCCFCTLETFCVSGRGANCMGREPNDVGGRESD